MMRIRDEFLSEEDLDLANLNDEELDAVWTAWLEQAQCTNDLDQHEFSHGVFLREPPWEKPEAKCTDGGSEPGNSQTA